MNDAVLAKAQADAKVLERLLGPELLRALLLTPVADMALLCTAAATFIALPPMMAAATIMNPPADAARQPPTAAAAVGILRGLGQPMAFPPLLIGVVTILLRSKSSDLLRESILILSLFISIEADCASQ